VGPRPVPFELTEVTRHRWETLASTCRARRSVSWVSWPRPWAPQRQGPPAAHAVAFRGNRSWTTVESLKTSARPLTNDNQVAAGAAAGDGQLPPAPAASSTSPADDTDTTTTTTPSETPPSKSSTSQADRSRDALPSSRSTPLQACAAHRSPDRRRQWRWRRSASRGHAPALLHLEPKHASVRTDELLLLRLRNENSIRQLLSLVIAIWGTGGREFNDRTLGLA